MTPLTTPLTTTRTTPLLEVEHLAVEYPTGKGWVRVVDDATFSVGVGETVGLVGESGSGKSVSSLAILGLVGAQHGRIPSGSIRFDGHELVGASAKAMADVRGKGIGMVFQQALRSLNPAFRVGDQIAETIRRNENVSRREASGRAVELLDRVHIPKAAERARNYPHEFSGGMCQRAMIAMAIACKPRLLIADEPTTALDVTVQSHILDLLRELQADTGVSVLFISHDLAVIAEMCERVAVMYAGQVVEQAATSDLFRSPQHPYTQGLVDAIPRRGQGRLAAIPGNVPHVTALPTGCRFHPRCPHAVAVVCDAEPPALIELDRNRATRCVRYDEIVLGGITA
jgi:peptide/nickel transport system ATP-binding protein